MGGISFCNQLQLPERQSIAHFFRFSVGVCFLSTMHSGGGRRKYTTQRSVQNVKETRSLIELDVCLSVHRCICVEKKNQLDATEWFIALIICSTCFGHFYAHHQELEIMCVLLPPVVCSALVAGCRGSGAGQQAMCPG
jgi:hypothetical protein